MVYGIKFDIAAALVIVLVITGAVCWLNKQACEQRTISFADSKFGIIAGCLVYHDDMWLPLENIRGFD